MGGRGLKLGVVGTGLMGGHHVRTASSLPGVNLVGIFDLDQTRAQALSTQYGLTSFSSFKQMLPSLEAVIIASPTTSHFELTQAALTAGKHVFLEKPFTGDPLLAKQLIDLALPVNRVLAAGLIEYFNPAFLRLLKLLKDEKVHGINIKRLSPFPERIADTNVVFDLMIHDLLLLQFLVPDDFIDIRAEGKKVQSLMLDQVSAKFVSKNGVISLIESSRVFGVKTRNITVTTDKHLIDCDLLNRRIYLRDFSSPTPSTVPVKQQDQLTEEQRSFVLAIKGRSPYPIPNSLVLRSIQLAKEIESLC